MNKPKVVTLNLQKTYFKSKFYHKNNYIDNKKDDSAQLLLST
jgi:hypothetical protein